MTGPDRKALAKAYLDAAVLEAIARLSPAEAHAAVDTVTAAPRPEQSPREARAMAHAARRTAMLEEARQLAADGRKRAAAAIVAKRWVADPNDPVAIKSLADQIRRWRRAA
jgi:hypothetical protein